jgi:CheY-like chemotaxis protein
MGLGLAIVERACALLQHPLELKSRVGAGTLFSVELPRAHPQPSQAHQAVFRHHVQPGDVSNMVVLLIENDAELRNAMAITMEQWSVDVLTCAGGSEAMELLDEIDITPDAIVADYQLDDGQDGLTAIRDLRAAHGAIPACVISANRSTDLVRACEAANLPRLYKPLDPPLLRDFLQRSSAPPKPIVIGTTRRSVAE